MGILDKFKKNQKADEPQEKKEAPKSDAVVNVAKPKKEDAKKSDVSPKYEKDGITEETAGIIIKPVVSEKSTNLGQSNQYVFEVSAKANKLQIAKAIKARYGVEPIRVNVINVLGKYVRYGKSFGKQKDFRKAIVFLPEGKTISVFEGA